MRESEKEEKKQKAIELAYGEYWDRVKDFVDVNGWCSVRRKVNFEEITNKLGWQCKIGNQHSWRPKSLSGIEDNNGWISIEREDDLPKEDEKYWIKDKCNNVEILTFKSNENCPIWRTQITHYQNIEQPSKPIY